MNRRTPSVPRCLALLLAAALALAPALIAGPSSAAVPRAPHRYTARIEPLAAYKGQAKCSPWAKPGTQALANMLLRTYPRTRSLGIVRACNVGAKSEHKEGRAFDWGVSVHNARDRRAVKSLMTWLLKKDRFGHRYAMARRLGIQYMIWNRRIWGSYAASSGWRRYTGSNPHTDHVHFSLSWAGARKSSSFWRPRGFTSPRPRPRPTRPPAPAPDPRPTPTTTAIPEPRTPRSLADGPALTVEQVDLPAGRRAGVVTVGALRRGHRYLIEASGRYKYAAGGYADAECSTARGSSWWRDRSVRRDQAGADHLDVYVDGHDPLADADNGQSCDPGSHTYRWVYAPDRDGRVPLRIWDPTGYRNNDGRLAITITDLAVRDRMTWRVPARAETGATSPGSLRGGVDYRVTVSGTWGDGTGVTADAECSRSAYADWRRDRYDVLVSGFHSYGLSADRTDVSGEPALDTGGRCDRDGHTYSFVWRADESQPLNLRVQDPGKYSDNSGSLRVTVAPAVAGGDPGTPQPIPAETVQVDSRSSGTVQTDRVYPQGTRLRLTASGTYLMRQDARWIVADAECTIASDDLTWRSSRHEGMFDGRKQPLGDVVVNGRVDTWVPKGGSGSCTGGDLEADHGYTFDLTTDRNGPLSLVIADDDYADNRGTVSVRVEVR